MSVEKIISGGQTGADQGALAAAKLLGYATGGWMPKGFHTEDEDRPEFGGMYGMKAHSSEKYPPRTLANVEDSDATVWIGNRNDSKGLACTERAAKLLRRPFLVTENADELRTWAEVHQVRVLNVAGSRASKDPKAFERAVEVVMTAFAEASVAATLIRSALVPKIRHRVDRYERA